jgi:hypothetical protein
MPLYYRRNISEKNEIIRKLNHDADMLRAETSKNMAILKELETANNEYKLLDLFYLEFI